MGSAIYEILKENKIDVYGIDKHGRKSIREYDIMHVCIPFTDDFIGIVLKYDKEYSPSIIVIHSTVKPGTTSSFRGMNVVYSPVRGKHPNMKKDIYKYNKWIGGKPKLTNKVAELFERCGIKTRVMSNQFNLELAKILETSYIGWKIVFFQELRRMGRIVDYDMVCDFLEETSKIYRRAGIIDNKDSEKHCITENIKLIDGLIPKIIKESNEKRKLELSD